MDNANTLFTRRILDLIGMSERQNRQVCSRFLSPAEQADAIVVAKRAGLPPASADTAGYYLYGGIPDAERRRIYFLPEPAADGDPLRSIDTESGFRIIEITASAGPGEGPGHRDVLGAVLAAGIRRDFIGDIHAVPADARAWIVVDPSVLGQILQSVDRIGRYPVKMDVLPSGESPLTESEVSGIPTTGTVASLRLDSVAALAFHLNRSEMAERIRKGDVQVNWVACADPDRLLRQGDRITLRGSGKAVLTGIGGQSRKGRLFITTERPG